METHIVNLTRLQLDGMLSTKCRNGILVGATLIGLSILGYKLYQLHLKDNEKYKPIKDKEEWITF